MRGKTKAVDHTNIEPSRNDEFVSETCVCVRARLSLTPSSRILHYQNCVTETVQNHTFEELLLLQVFSPWAGLGRDQSSVR
jgi:hypothetical protein